MCYLFIYTSAQNGQDEQKEEQKNRSLRHTHTYKNLSNFNFFKLNANVYSEKVKTTENL